MVRNATGVFAFVAFGGFIVIFYNLGLWHNRFHTDLWFAFSWGAFPVLTSYWVNASRLDVAVVLLAVGCFLLTLAQRTLSIPVRTIPSLQLSTWTGCWAHC